MFNFWKSTADAATTAAILLALGAPKVALGSSPWKAIESQCGDVSGATGESSSCSDGRALERKLTHRKLQRALCENPQSYCEEVRALSEKKQFQQFTGPSCEVSPYTRNMLTIGTSLLADGDPASSEAILAAAKALPEGENGLDGAYVVIREQVARSLQSMNPRAPDAVARIVRETRLVTSRRIEGEPREVQEAWRSICGLQGLPGEDGTPASAPGLMNFNAFYYEGAIYTCPQMELNWMEGDLEGAAVTLAHELGHAVSLDTLGSKAASWAKAEDGCTLNPERLDSEQHAIVDHLQSLKKIHACLADADAFIAGKSGQVLARINGRTFTKTDPVAFDALLGCAGSRTQLERSPKWGMGLTATESFDSFVQASFLASFGSDRRLGAKLVSAARLVTMAILPHHDQFQETYADVVATQALPKILAEFRKNHAYGMGSLTRNEQHYGLVRSLSFFCGMSRQKEKARDPHPIDFRRVELFAASPEVREELGCSQISPKFQPSEREQRIARCLNP